MMRSNHLYILITALVFVSACALPGTAGRGHSRQRADYLGHFQAELNHLDTQINGLKAQADRAQGNAKAALNADLDQLRKKQALAQQRMAQIEAASEDSWQSLRAGADAALNDLKKACDQAVARFNRGS